MRIDQLKPNQLEDFLSSAAVTKTCLGGRKFTAKISINGKQQKITTSAKNVYKQINKEHPTLGYKKFHNLELDTRDKKEFSKRLNPIQKIYYSIVKAFSGLDFSDTWTGKFLENTEDYTTEAAKKIQDAFNCVNGSAFDHVLVNIVGRQHSSGIIFNESAWLHPGSKELEPEKWEYFHKYIFHNPKALIITVLAKVGPQESYRDTSIPEDSTCGVYYMLSKEYNALPRVSKNLIEFIKERERLAKKPL